MTCTSAEANKILKKLLEEKVQIEREESQRSSFVCATIENPEDIRPEYDFNETFSNVSIINKKIRTIKHALNIFNSTHIVPGFDMTVDELLVYMPQLTAMKDKLSRMSQKPEKARRGYGYGEKPTNFIEYEYANYDVKEVAKVFTVTSDELMNAQIALDKLNTTETLEFDIDM